jgi:hypothetical protein
MRPPYRPRFPHSDVFELLASKSFFDIVHDEDIEEDEEEEESKDNSLNESM